MADLLSINLTTAQESAGTKFTVKAKIRFSPREVSENFIYGVSFCVMRDDKSVVVIPIPMGVGAMQWSTYPISPPKFFVVSGSDPYQPNGRTEIDVMFERTVPTVASEDKHVAWVCALPEVAWTAYVSPTSIAP